MYVPESDLPLPSNPEMKIWRYMDFAKYVHLLQTRSLFFTRSDRFEDPYEGALSARNKEFHKTNASLYGFSEEDQDSIHEQISDSFAALRKSVFISCWHMNEYESAAMWKLYARNDEGIAIQSTVKKLSDSFKGIRRDVFMSSVLYVDYDAAVIPNFHALHPFIHKRKSFEHENELRAMCFEINYGDFGAGKVEYGIDVNTNLVALIERIYVAPTTPTWKYNLVKNITEKYNIPADIIQSDLYSKPII